MITKKDYLIAVVNGLLTGVFGLVVLFFLEINFLFKIPLVILGVPVLWVLGVWLGGFLGARVAKFFTPLELRGSDFNAEDKKNVLFRARTYSNTQIKVLTGFTQFGKFAAVGFSSASIDFAILNFMSYVTGITAGITVGWVNIPGFLVAVLNGYLWNRLWVFKLSQPTAQALQDLAQARGGRASREIRQQANIRVFAKPGAEASLFHDFPKFFGVTTVGLLINSGIIVLLTTYFTAPALDEKIWLNIAKVIANAVALIWNFVGYKFIAFSHGEK